MTGPRRLLAVSCLLGLLIVVSFSVSAWSFYSGHRESCQSRNSTLNVLRDILLTAQQQGSAEPRTATQATRAAAFYATAFARIDKARCS